MASGVRSSWKALAAKPFCLGAVCFEPREHRVEGVGEFAELVFEARQPNPMGERPGRGNAGRVR